jgi:hypothetical protein
MFAQGTQPSVKKNNKVRRSGAGVITEVPPPPQALNSKAIKLRDRNIRR